jgi:Tol biopolymer transport system component
MTERATIGPYRIVARVGAGGMGEVFKAWDPRLERDVAVKLLHREAAGDPERQKRLLAEGRAASALNHPNILRVYDADVDGDAYYLVSEWLEGKSLRDELARGPVPLKRLLDLAVQIADGLAAAHAMGIVHRDIKPDNIMLARDGTARIVDFGLARAEHRAAATSETVAPSTTVSLDGGISGTPAYMSPEQARGTLGDFRTDQFSFGAMLYELATGRHAFRRDSIADTLAAVLHEDPRPIIELNPRLPAPLRWIIEQCLAKDPSERYGATEDLARDVRRVRDRLAEAIAAIRLDVGPVRSRVSLLAAAATAAAVIGVVVGFGLAPVEQAAPPSRVFPFATASGYEAEPAWSPDGQSLAYSADVDGVLQVFVKRVGDALSRQITHGQFDAQAPFWSQDGQRVYYVSLAGADDSLWSVAIAGGRPSLELTNVATAALDPDGSRLALLRVDPDAAMRQTLWWSSPPGAEPVREMRPPFDHLRNGGDTALRFSRDGQLLVWMYDIDYASQGTIAEPSAFYVVPKGDGAPRPVLRALSRLTNPRPFGWWPDNRHVVVVSPDSIGNPHLWLADSVTGGLHPITSGHTGETDPAVDGSGSRIAYASQEVDFDLTLISTDGRSRRTFLGTTRNEYDPAWSPRGDQFAFVTDRSGTLEIWARSRDGQWERPVVTAADFPDSSSDTLGSLAFSPSGTTLAYQRSSGGTWEIWLSPASGGAPMRLVNDAAPQRPWLDAPAWSPDGEWIAYVKNSNGEATVMKTRVGGTETVALLTGALVFSRPAWSPDGQWIVAQNEAEGLMLIPASGGTPQPLSPQTIFAATWRPDSRQVVALTESEKPGHFAIIELAIAGGEARILNPDLGPIPIANQPIRGLSLLGSEGFLTSLASARSDIWLLENFELPQRGWAGWLRALWPRNPRTNPLKTPQNP